MFDLGVVHVPALTLGFLPHVLLKDFFILLISVFLEDEYSVNAILRCLLYV